MLELTIHALFTAADEDSATGGPDLMRGIYPTIATITAVGFERAGEAEIAERFGVLLATLTARESERPALLPETSVDGEGTIA